MPNFFFLPKQSAVTQRLLWLTQSHMSFLHRQTNKDISEQSWRKRTGPRNLLEIGFGASQRALLAVPRWARQQPSPLLPSSIPVRSLCNSQKAGGKSSRTALGRVTETGAMRPWVTAAPHLGGGKSPRANCAASIIPQQRKQSLPEAGPQTNLRQFQQIQYWMLTQRTSFFQSSPRQTFHSSDI